MTVCACTCIIIIVCRKFKMAFANTLDGRDILQEGWLTVYKSRNPTFLTKQKVWIHVHL